MSIKPSTEGAFALTWVKSSYSTNDGPECVEVAWTKSSYSASDSNECVEVATTGGAVLIRDSKNKDGAHLAVTPDTWTGFVAHAATS
ncbi:DUF397 domain-containing protein [Streptomyces sp. NPDC002990]